VIIGGQKFILQLIPCGVLRPTCKGIIGNGVVLDPIAFLKEVAKLRGLGVAVDAQLFVSNRAQVILPYHRMIELAAESAPGRKKIAPPAGASVRHTKTRWRAAACGWWICCGLSC